MKPERQCAAVLVTDERGRILLVRQNYGPKCYGPPGGVVDPGETPADAAVREALEEAGVEVVLEHLVGTYLLRGGGLPDILASVYCGRIARGRPRIVDEREIARVDWFDPERLPEPLVPDAVAAIPDFLAGRRGMVRDHWREAPPRDAGEGKP